MIFERFFATIRNALQTRGIGEIRLHFVPYENLRFSNIYSLLSQGEEDREGLCHAVLNALEIDVNPMSFDVYSPIRLGSQTVLHRIFDYIPLVKVAVQFCIETGPTEVVVGGNT